MKAATGIAENLSGYGQISIHAAREGGDGRGGATMQPLTISIHAAREGGDIFSVFT